MLESKLSRRRCLGLSAEAAFVAGAKIAPPVIDQLEDWLHVNVNNREFVELNERRLSNLRIGTSFSPENFKISLWDFRNKPTNYRIAGQALDFATQNLGMNNVRLGLRWNSVELRDGEIDLSFYDPFIRSLLKKDVRVCLTYGVKTPGDPEQHYPSFIRNGQLMEPKGTTITPEIPLGEKSLDYIDRLSERLLQEYGPEAFHAIQIENEPFGRYGVDRHTFSSDYLNQGISLARDRFPRAKVLINGSEPEELKRAQAFFAYTARATPSLYGDQVLGIDYYYKKPGRLLSGIPVLKHLDPIVTGSVKDFFNPFELLREEANRHNTGIEITEGQADVWGPFKSPGKDPRSFRFMIKRGIDEMLDTSAPALLRTWGYEDEFRSLTTGDFTPGNRERFQLIQLINHVPLVA